jgi:hypothetical protein
MGEFVSLCWSAFTVRVVVIYNGFQCLYDKVSFLDRLINSFTSWIAWACTCLYSCMRPAVKQFGESTSQLGSLLGGYVKKTGKWVKGARQKWCICCNCAFDITGSLLEILSDAFNAFLGRVKDPNGKTVSSNVFGLITWAFLYTILFIFWIIAGPSGLGIPLYIQQTSEFIGDFIEFLINLTNGILIIVGALFFVLNVTRPFLNQFIYFFVQLFLFTIGDVISPPFRNDPRANGSGRTLQGVYDPASVYTASTALVFSYIHGFLVVLSQITGLFVVIFKVLSKFGLFLLVLLKGFASIGLFLGVCCASAPFCCARTFFRDLIQLIGVDIGQCNSSETAGMQCSCSRAEGGPLAADVSCQAPSYACKFDASSGNWQEYTVIQTNDPKNPVETISGRSNPDIKIACTNSLRSGESSSGRRVLQKEEEVCQDSCLLDGRGQSFSLVRCGEDVYLKGDCLKNTPRRLEGELWKEHLKKLKHHNIQNLKRQPPPLSGEFRKISKNEIKKRITREEFVRFLQENEESKTPESILYECDDHNKEDSSFENIVWRLHCVGLKKVNEKINNVGDLALLPLKHVAHVQRYLSSNDDVTFMHLLDNIAKTHNEHFPGDLREDHHETHRKLTEMGETIKKRSLEAIENLKRLNARQLLNAPDPKFYTCPCSNQVVKRGELDKCRQPTQEELEQGGCFARMLLYQVNVFGENFSFETIVKNTIQCFRSIQTFPELNPASLQGIEKEYRGEYSNLRYCFPMFAPLDYPGTFKFSWSEFVQSQCKPRPGISGTFFPCKGGLYDDSEDVFNWTEMWLSFIPKCVLVRLYNAWCCMQWLFTRLPIQWFDTIWGTIMAFFGASLSVQNAFSPTYASQGLPDGTNWFLFSIHSFSLLWFLIFVLIPLYLFWTYFYVPLWIIISGIWKKFILPIIFKILRSCTLTRKEKIDIEKTTGELHKLMKFTIAP